MSVSFMRVVIAGIAVFLAVCVFVFVWYGSSLHVQKTIEEWENLGTAHLDKFIVCSHLTWNGVRRSVLCCHREDTGSVEPKTFGQSALL